MILVISEEQDISSDNFMEWCHYKGTDVIRINQSESAHVLHNIVLDDQCNISLNIKGKLIALDSIQCVWFRRGLVTHESAAAQKGFADIEPNQSIREYFKNEANTIDEFVTHTLRQKKSLSYPYNYNANKLIVLKTAIGVGLKVPKTVITKNAEDVFKQLNDREFITKPIQDSVGIKYQQYSFYPVPRRVKKDDQNIPPRFYYSKFQSLINSKYELRVFFIKDQYYASAQFSNATGLRSEYRRMQTDRVVPYILPADVLDKLKKLNKISGFDCGSIDMLVDDKDDHYFLEINPVGQYDFMSIVCNYNLDLELLNHFTNEGTF